MLTMYSIYWVCATVGRLIMAKMWLVAHHPLSYNVRGSTQALPQDIKDRLFVTSVEVIEFSSLLESNEQTAKWSWLFRTYMQWHAVVFVLSQLIVRPPNRDYERAWKAVDRIYDFRVESSPRSQKGMLWKPMRLLMKKAREVRDGHQKRGDLCSDYANDAASIAFAESFIGPSPAASSISNPDLPAGSIRPAAEAFGLDFGANFDEPDPMTGPLFPMSIPENPQPDYFASHQNITERDISAWLQHEQMAQLNPDFLKWSGTGLEWTSALQNLSATIQGMPPFPSTADMEGVQEWF